MTRLKFEHSVCGFRLRQSGRSAFTLKELLTCIATIGVLLAISLPAIQSARESQRRIRCISNLQQIGLALLNYDDGRRCLPPISSNIDSIADVPGNASTTTNSINSAPGSADSPGAGYSWMVWILPELEEGPLYQTIANNSRKFVLPAFDPAIENGSGGKLPHCASVQLQEFICPSFTDGQTLDTTPRRAGSVGAAVETGTIPPNYVGGIAATNGALGIAITNYNAILGTHIDDIGPAVSAYLLKSASLPTSNNGGMQFRGRSYDCGFRLSRNYSAFKDGASKVPLVAETRERRFASWYDGTMNWVVASRHSNPAAGTTAIIPANNTTTGAILGLQVVDLWVIGTDGTTATGGSALNYGPTADNPTAVYLPTAALSDPDISGIAPGRLWGPSSQHKGGLVNHAFGDAHVEAISDQIDPNVYLWIVTRGGGEPLPELSGGK